MSSHSGDASCELLYIVYVYVNLSEQVMAETDRQRLWLCVYAYEDWGVSVYVYMLESGQEHRGLSVFYFLVFYVFHFYLSVPCGRLSLLMSAFERTLK